MSIKVTLQCRNCDAYSSEILEDSTVSNFQSSEVSSFCTICENDSRVNIKVEEYVHRDLKSDKKSLLYIPENSFTTTSTSTTTTTIVLVSQPDNPGDTKNCGDFETYDEAKVWFDTYYEYYGDVARLDRDDDLEPCESLPGGP